MSDRARKCLVIAAGRGSSLESDGLPKPLFRLLGLPLIERAIVTAKRAGLDDFTVITGYDGARIRRFLDRLAIRRMVAITHVVNDSWQADNGVSVLKAREAIGEEPFALLMADHVVSMKARFERGEFRIGRDLRVLIIALGAVVNLPFLALVLIAGIMNVETLRRVVAARDPSGSGLTARENSLCAQRACLESGYAPGATR